MTITPKIDITKMEAARRQTDSAITMWFFDADPVSIYTLGSAALGILNDIGKKIGEPAMVYNPAHFKQGMFKKWLKVARASQNFFKHADKDPDGVHEFRPSNNEYLLSDCVDTYFRITSERPPVMHVFWKYFIVQHPEYFDSVMAEAIPVELTRIKKPQFFKEALPVFHAGWTDTST